MRTGSEFTINGRFLSQTPTGVQRYAQNVVMAMDAQLQDGSMRGQILAPAGARRPEVENLSMVTKGPLSGHLWEQIVLPGRSEGMLLNLCNLAPVIKTRQIVCIHDANVFTAQDSYSRHFQALYRMMQPYIARRATRVTTVSAAAARQIARHLQIRESEIAVLHNGHEHALAWNADLADIAPAFFARHYADGDRAFVIALGSRARHKNLALLIEAAADLDRMGIDLVIAGGGSSIFSADDLALRKNIKLLDRVSDADLAFLLDRALCLMFPSLAEGFGLPIIEAMARGCPVISSNCASMPEVCGTAALLASPFNASAWVAQVRRLKNEPGLRAELIGQGRRNVDRFSWSATADGYLELLEQPAARLAKGKACSTPLSAAVVIATRGRPAVVSETVRHLLSRQSLKPNAVIVSCVDLSDAGDLIDMDGVEIIVGPPGLAAQRNNGLASLPGDTDIVVFFDDDFVADQDWLRCALQVFQDESSVVGFTGGVIADGIKGPGIEFAEAVEMLAAGGPETIEWKEPYSPYGCNMAFRMSAIVDVKFDERLVLYGWLEDRDFAASVARRGGRLVKSNEVFGVHMGTKSGRVNGVRLGYSQVINPIYMYWKGTMSLRKVIDHIVCNMAINIARAPHPETFIDRRGRLKGNLKGIFDALRGRLEPERAATLVVSPPVNTIRPLENAR